jgi:hypothetical protein
MVFFSRADRATNDVGLCAKDYCITSPYRNVK